MKKDSGNPLGFFVFIISFLWLRIFAAHLITARGDLGPVLIYTRDTLAGYFLSYGGIADLFSVFLAQFFINPWLGSLVLSLLLTSFVYRAFSASKKNAAPVILLWILTLAFLTLAEGSLLYIVAFSIILRDIEEQDRLKEKGRSYWLERFITLPLLIWVTGSWAFLYVVILVFRDAGIDKKFTALTHVFIGYAAVLGLIVQRLIWPMPIKTMLFGSLPLDSFWGLAFLLIGAAAALYPCLPRKEHHGLTYVAIMASMILFILISIMNGKDPDKLTERWRILAERSQYNKIIRMAENIDLKDPQQAMILNYALAKEDRLLEEMFSFDQSLEERGLLADITDEDSLTGRYGSWLMKELYANMGRYDAALAIAENELRNTGFSPSNSKMLVKCLIKENKIDRAHELLEQFKHTLMYRRWSKRQLNTLPSEPVSSAPDSQFAAINAVPILLATVERDSLNKFANNYLCAEYLLERKTIFLAENLKTMKSLGYKSLPRHYQEALLMHDFEHPDEEIRLEGYILDQDVLTAYNEFGNTYMNDPQPNRTNYQKKFNGSYLLYWFFNIR